MAVSIEAPKVLTQQETATRSEIKLPIKGGRIFSFLRRIRFLDNVYPFSLRGPAYLSSSWKRGMDLSLGFLGMIPAAPLIGLGALAVKIESPHLPSIIRQKRHGREGVTFGMYKMRTMTENLEHTGEIKPTVIGKILRVTSVDELPQLINVIFGEMSLVGRRPILDVYLRNLEELMRVHLPYIRAKKHFGFTDEAWQNGAFPDETQEKIRTYADAVREETIERMNKFKKRNEGKPGITGLYQILGRREIAEHHRVRLDLFYEDHASLGFDLAILAATLPAVVSKRGAF